MSDDEQAGANTRARASGRATTERRTPRFSWNPAYEETFFRSLCESMQMGYKENASFKTGAWERAAIALRDKHNEFPEKSHLVNKADNARKKFRMWRALREDPDFLYNPNTHMVSASEEAWQRHFAREHLIKALRGRPFEHEEYMEILFPDVIGSGGAPKRIMKPRRRGPDGNLIPRSPGNDTTVADHDTSRMTEGGDDSFTASSLQPLINASSTPSRQAAAAASSILPPSTTAAHSTLTPPNEQSSNSNHNNNNNNNDNNTNSARGQKRGAPPIDPSVMGGRPEKRRGRPSRFSAQFYQTSTATPPPAAFASGSGGTPRGTLPHHPSYAAGSSSSNNHDVAPIPQDTVLNLIESLTTKLTDSGNPKKWQEQAVDILFRDFTEEDLDLQLKIAEKALADDHKAMVFVKMTDALRRHYVARLRDVHLRTLPSSAVGGLGRVMEDNV